MKARLLARSVYLSIALIVTMAVGGCIVAIPVPVTEHLDPVKPDAMPAGATKGATKGKIIEKFSFPEAKTFDGRFFLYEHRWENHWMWLVGIAFGPSLEGCPSFAMNASLGKPIDKPNLSLYFGLVSVILSIHLPNVSTDPDVIISKPS